jgi:uncharacterized protein (DUF302 family)
MENIEITVKLDCSYAEAVDRTTEELKKQGFGVLTRIDIHDALKEKINVDFRKYTILGACNPPLAHKALQATAAVGLMLPCNVTVEEEDGGALVRIINPKEMMRMGGFDENEELAAVGTEAYDRLQVVATALRG